MESWYHTHITSGSFTRSRSTQTPICWLIMTPTQWRHLYTHADAERSRLNARPIQTIFSAFVGEITSHSASLSSFLPAGPSHFAVRLVGPSLSRRPAALAKCQQENQNSSLASRWRPKRDYLGLKDTGRTKRAGDT